MKFSKKSSLRKTVVQHRLLWKWLTHNPDKPKKEWSGFQYFSNKIENDCFACHTASFTSSGACGNACCFLWPIIEHWSENACLNSYYYEWVRTYQRGNTKTPSTIDTNAENAAMIWALQPKKWNYGKYSW